MEGENVAAKLPQSVEAKEEKAEPAVEAEEKKVELTDAAAPSKEAVDNKKSEEEGEPDAADKRKDGENASAAKKNADGDAKSPSEAVDEKKSEETSEPMDVDQGKEEPKEKEAEPPSVVGERNPQETSESVDDGNEPKDESKEDSKDESKEESKDDSKEEPKDEPMEESKEESNDEEDGSDTDTEKISEPLPTGRGMRQRKSTQIYQPGAENDKERVIPKGKGQKLKDIPRVVANFEDITRSDPDLNSLYTIVFGRGKKKDYKSHLLEFSGLVYPEGKEETEQEKIRTKMYKLKMDGLKDVMDLADINRAKTTGKEELCTLFLEWLEEPKVNPNSTTKKGKRKSAGSDGKGSAKKATPAKKAKKTTPSKKKTSAKKTPPAKKKTPVKFPSPKKTPVKRKTPTKKSTPKKTASPKKAKAVNLNIPGVDLEKLREKVKSIVDNADRKELTVKMVRKMLEDWLDTDLSNHKDAIRSLVMEVM